MGQCCSGGPLPTNIGNFFAEDMGKDDDVLKLLLLGTGNAGKTTILKQFRLKYGTGFSDAERFENVNVIRNGFVSAMHKLLYAVDDLLASEDIDLPPGVPLKYPDDIKPLVAVVKSLPDGIGLNDSVTIDMTNRKHNGALDSSSSDDDSNTSGAASKSSSSSSRNKRAAKNRKYSKSTAGNKYNVGMKTMLLKEILLKLWENPLVQIAYSHSNLIASLEEPVAYVIKNLDRITAPDYIPTDLDILNVRTPTEEVEVLNFQFKMKSKEETPCRIIDVGGQRYFRRRWISEFEDLHAVLFVVGLDGFDQVIVEDGKTNRIAESLELFQDLCASPFLTKVSFILVLNKLDVFKEKWRKLRYTYKKNPRANTLKSFFSMGSSITPANNYREAISYISNRFVAVHTQEMRRAAKTRPSIGSLGEFDKPRVYPFVTCATDIDTMGTFVYKSMKTIITLKNLAFNFQ